MPLNCIFQMVEMVHFVLCVFYHNRRKKSWVITTDPSYRVTVSI